MEKNVENGEAHELSGYTGGHVIPTSVTSLFNLCETGGAYHALTAFSRTPPELISIQSYCGMH